MLLKRVQMLSTFHSIDILDSIWMYSFGNLYVTFESKNFNSLYTAWLFVRSPWKIIPQISQNLLTYFKNKHLMKFFISFNIHFRYFSTIDGVYRFSKLCNFQDGTEYTKMISSSFHINVLKI